MDRDKMIEEAKFQQHVLDDLKYIRGQVKRTNGRVDRLEEEMLEATKNIAEAFKIISQNSGSIKAFKEDKDQAKDDLIEELKEAKDKGRINWTMVIQAVITAVVTAVVLGTIMK